VTWKNVLGMLLLVGLGIIALVFMQDDGAPGDGRPNGVVRAFDKGAVTRIEAEAKGGETLALRRREGDSESWDLDIGQEWARADAIAVDEILTALVRAEVMQFFPAETVTPAQREGYGLETPAVSFKLDLPSGERTARFGVFTREGSGAYADRGPDTDVMVVPAIALREFDNAFQSGLRDSRVSDLRTYDVKAMEITQSGITTMRAEKDLTQVWKFTQPFTGYAEPIEFETRISHLVNEKWSRIVEDGAQDLERYGLARPAAEISLTSKRGTTHTMLLGGPVSPDGGDRYFAEKGYHSVYVVSKRFADAVLDGADDVRDRSFTRLGLGIESVVAGIGDASFELSKAHDWEIEKPAREPAEESVVEDFLEQLRQWPILEFMDRENPLEFGITPDCDEIQIGTHGGALTTLSIGMQRTDGNYYAQRKGDGGLVVVLGTVVEQFKKGWLQFKRRSAIELPIEDIDFVGRAKGNGPEGADVTDEKWSRDLDGQDKSWKAEIGKVGGGLDPRAMGAFLSALRSVAAREWYHWDTDHDAEMGFGVNGYAAATTRIELDLRGSDAPPIVILVGKKVEGRNAYYARRYGTHFAFAMDASVVAEITKPLTKPR